jgi:hypothetical protein
MITPHVNFEDSHYFHSVHDNPTDDPIYRVAGAISHNHILQPDQKRLLQKILVSFKLLAMRSAQEVSRVASGSSLQRLPKDLCRMVGGMFV